VPHLNKSLARSNKNPFHQGFLTEIVSINLREFFIIADLHLLVCIYKRQKQQFGKWIPGIQVWNTIMHFKEEIHKHLFHAHNDIWYLNLQYFILHNFNDKIVQLVYDTGGDYTT